MPKGQHSIIKVIGVGGGGGNAVNHMYKQGIKGVDFVICNTDNQALDLSPVPTKIQLGSSLTEGRGAGSLPEVGMNAAIENIDELKAILGQNTKMVFITAGMGGGTGTGAAPVIAQVAKEMGILTVGIVTIPFVFEGKKRRNQAEEGISRMRDSVDTLLVICNDRLREMYGNLNLSEAFAQADNVLSTAAKGIAEIITVTGSINVDFEDVRTVMTNSGVAIMGSATAEGESRAVRAVENALASPLLNDNDIKGARYVLLNITYGSQEVLFDEIADITDFIQDESGGTADVIWGHGLDESLGDEICVTLIATGFQKKPDTGLVEDTRPKRRVMSLNDDVPTTLTAPNAKAGAAAPQTPSATPTPVQQNPYAKPTPPPAKSIEELEEPFLKSEPSAPVQHTPIEPVDQEPYIVNRNESEQLNAEQAEEPATEQRFQKSLEFDMGFGTPQSGQPQEESTPSPFTFNESAPAVQPTPVDQSWGTAEEQDVPQNVPAAEPDQQKKASDRIMRLKELSMKLRAPSGITDLENEPAYKRRNIELDQTPHSSESEVSRFTLSEEEGEDGEQKTNLRSNNSFLHDNVD